jgi:outer membrane immunogenic protein
MWGLQEIEIMRLRGILLASAAAILASSGMARAADAVVYEPAPEVIPGFTWTGAYIGIQGGYGWTDLSDDGDTLFEDNLPDDDDSIDLDGGFAGVYAGYNYQWTNNLVLGIEGDINKAWMDEDIDDFGGEPAEFEVDWFGSVRGRIGYAWDRTLLFATAGVAFASVDYNLVEFDVSDDENFVGWTVGVGVEHAFTDNLLARAEYRYYDFGSETIGNPTFPSGVGEVELDMQTISIGLAYKF